MPAPRGIECYLAGVRDTGASRASFVAALANALVAYFGAHLQMAL